MGLISKVLAALLLVGTFAHVDPAASSTPEPQWVPSFNESPGCEDLDGVRGPLASKAGGLTHAEPIYGPWADFYGRTQGLVHSQLVPVKLPGLSKTLYVHQRVLPAFNAVLDNLAAEAANGNVYEIRSDTWSYNAITIPPGRAYSFHTVGAAIDVNSNTNPYRADNILITDMIEDDPDHPNPDWFIDAWRDAGWCWGGDWQSIKDPMHFSWKGPLHDPTPGYTVPSPQPPLVSTASFTAGQYLPASLPATSSDDRYSVADLDRDGAADIVRIRPQGGGTVRLDIAEARNWYTTNRLAGTTAVPPTDLAAPLALADMTHDGRPDLVYVLDNAGLVSLEVFTFTGLGGVMPRSTVATSIPTSPGAVYLFDDFDRNGDADLFVVRAGSPGTIEVWLGPEYSSATITQTLTIPSTGRQFGLGERWLNGIPDLFALSANGTMVIHRGSTAYTTASTSNTIAMPNRTAFIADVDGDGYGDLLLLGAAGSTHMLRGGQSTHEAGRWFVVDTSLLPDYAAAPFSHEIGWLLETGVSRGCNPPTNTLYCPERLVTRGEMATFFMRVFGLSPSNDNGSFTDHIDHTHQTSINAIRIAGLTVGCSTTRYCPNGTLTRAEIATMLARAFGLPKTSTMHYTDISGHWGVKPINSMAQAGMTWSCNPPTNDRFCPNAMVSRAEMAAWLYEAWRLGHLPHLRD